MPLISLTFSALCSAVKYTASETTVLKSLSADTVFILSLISDLKSLSFLLIPSSAIPSVSSFSDINSMSPVSAKFSIIETRQRKSAADLNVSKGLFFKRAVIAFFCPLSVRAPKVFSAAAKTPSRLALTAEKTSSALPLFIKSKNCCCSFAST